MARYDLPRVYVGKIVCRATRAERYDCGHVLMGDRAYEPRVEAAGVVRMTGPCSWCRRLAEWTREVDA